ncbi:MAG: type III-A CRISPR-associated protein Csm2 [Coriobacteriales bacterium]|jgi:CRISPR-associated protein Csm2|nr:type III-A CRISPR-associated protein Csm2 [Coriobacteriales bacterium]
MEEIKPVVLLKFKDGSQLDDTSFALYAEKRISKTSENGAKVLRYPALSMTKLRNIYGLITNIYTKINTKSDFEKRIPEIQYLKVKMAYEAGRAEGIKSFLDETYLMKAIDYIKTYEQFLLYCRYAESLVAYFVYYGGKD